MDGPEPQDEQGLRESTRDRRSVHVRGDDASDGEEIGPPVRFFRQFLSGAERAIREVRKVGNKIAKAQRVVRVQVN